MRIYTRSGDKGKTSLIYGKRVNKNDIRVEAYGTCDEANSSIGMALSYLSQTNWDGKKSVMDALHKVQTILFHVGAELATPSGKEVAWKLKQEHIDDLEEQIDEWDASLDELKNFILPSGHPAAASLHVARTIVRRAERMAVAIEDLENDLVLQYLNRLSDYLFVAARFVNKELNGEELPLNTEV
ncbi:cob(I)yrinic acid a,c-diamide adenosyltransferase [Tenuibacillus multivorans]|uniref:Corrinoid adenosyltransferase n=1 Tax=Tenuibacillus multivorans TaxID=237069 RepID=A0A1H0FXL2_9BACI|nr:cob(I)yrinic acid a,c-diamide adenosyltransferase [Tenuibacillus multivorans]GEL78169.1 ATP--cob(I)alamin adenosyltransferase [Tenuibacillus multivorans]SDN99350.1 cob(I)alamin adenosyltransferase [Tenuibacillus multivorans]